MIETPEPKKETSRFEKSLSLCRYDDFKSVLLVGLMNAISYAIITGKRTNVLMEGL